MIKQLLPRTLFGRSLLIIVTPLIVLQLVSAYVFYESHWDTVSWRMARDLAGDMGVIVDSFRDLPEPAQQQWLLRQARQRMGIDVSLAEHAILTRQGPSVGRGVEQTLANALREHIDRPFRVDIRQIPSHVVVDVQMPEGVVTMVVSSKRLFSSTTYVFVLWMLGTSMILLGVASIFMRNQVRPVLRLARAAEAFGKGRDMPRFKPQGAAEVRQAAAAFIAMRQRILRQIQQRTALLSGVSHDLRTPLTRMKLQLEMMPADDGIEALKGDLTEMERMLDAYLAFARGEGSERPVPADIGGILGDVVEKARRNGASIALEAPSGLEATVRPLAFRRAVTNLVENATRYARHVSVLAERRRDVVEVLVDDDGPGIAEAEREEVFRPFYRIEGSRNPLTGGVGLGLTIARDVIRGHGGDVTLSDSPLGGLRARLWLPL
ncbi:MAG: HAMP domain-containing protein [Rhodospirillales bacterium]|nr:MAG: HAMP domain-containing protein [Rhodospirillales bacterium]